MIVPCFSILEICENIQSTNTDYKYNIPIFKGIRELTYCQKISWEKDLYNGGKNGRFFRF